MHISTLLAGACALATIAGVAEAQQSRGRVERLPGGAWSVITGNMDPDRAVIGVNIGSGSARDTLGLLVADVTEDGPAAKAGITEGSRLAAINGVSLRLDPADAGDSDMQGIVYRRLTRELGKIKAGDEVSLRVWSDGRTRDVRVKTVAARELETTARYSTSVGGRGDGRPVLGLGVGTTGSARDTLGLFVMRVTPDGPAEKAGIIEGDRIAAIGGVDLTVDRADAEDQWAGNAMMNRFRREQGKLSVDQEVELRVVRDGRSRTVRVKPVRSSDLPRRSGGAFFFGDGAFADFVMPPIAPRPPEAPDAPGARRYFRFDGGPGATFHFSPGDREELRRSMEEAMRELRDRLPGTIELRATPRARGRITVQPAPTPRPAAPVRVTSVRI